MRKLNVKFAVILALCVIGFGLAVHLLHGIQTNDSAETLKLRATELKDENELREALKLFAIYIRLRPDDTEAQVVAANISADIGESPSAVPTDIRDALGRMEKTLLQAPDASELRRRLVTWRMRYRQWVAAIDHLRQLGVDQPDAEVELKLLYCQSLLQSGSDANQRRAVEVLHEIVGFDPEKKVFDSEAALAADTISAYQSLWSIHNNKKQSELAQRFIDQMLKINPESADAHLAHARVLMADGKVSEARSAIEKALEIDPDDVSAILTMADFNIQERKYDEALKRLDHGIEKYPENEQMYMHLERLARSQGKSKEARSAIEQGLDKIPSSNLLRWRLAMHQVSTQEIDDVVKTIDILKESNFWPDKLDFLRALVTMIEGDVVGASRELERVRPLLSKYRDGRELIPLTDRYLASCYAQMGNDDQQMEALERFLLQAGIRIGPRIQLATVYENLGMTKKAAKLYADFRKALGDNYYKVPAVWRNDLAFQIRQQLLERTPDWTDVNQIIEGAVAQGDIPPEEIALLRSDLYTKQKKFSEARSQLDLAIKEIEKDIADNKRDKTKHPRYSSALMQDVQLTALEKDVDDALKRLANVEKIFGDRASIRLARANLLAHRNANDVSTELATLEAGIEDLDQNRIYNGLAKSYLRVGNTDAARRLYKMVRDKNPHDLPVRTKLFDLAQQTDDEEEIAEALDEIEKLCGKKSSTWRFCKATRLFAQAVQTEDRVKLLDEASQLLKEIENSDRNKWHLRPRLQAEIARLQQDNQEAINRLEASLELGPATPKSVSQLMQLYVKNSQFKKARNTIALLKSGQLTPELRRAKIRFEMIDGNQKTALAEAKQLMDDLIKNETDKAGDHLWFAGVLKQLKQDDAAEKSYRVAVEKSPEDPRTWLALVQHLASMRKFLEASDTVREVELALPEEQLPLVLPECYQAIGKVEIAKQLYLEALEAYPGNLQLLRAMALLSSTMKEHAAARKYYNRIIASKDQSALGDSSRAWARREKAKLIASSGDHEDYKRALALIRQNYADGGSPTIADLNTEIGIISRRPEFIYKLDAIKKILSVREQRRKLPNGMLLMLAQLYDNTGKWLEAREAMTELISRDHNNADYRIVFARMYIRHEEYSDARRQLGIVEKLTPGSWILLELRAEVDHADGKTDEAIARIKKIVPPATDDSSLSDNRVQLLLSVAQLYERIDQPLLAEALYRRYEKIRPKDMLRLAMFLARQAADAKSIDEALDIGDRAKKTVSIEGVLTLGIRIVMSAKAKGEPISAKQMARIDRWFLGAKNDDPESVNIRMLIADLRSVQDRYDDATEIYRNLLSDKNVPTELTAVIRNNLAFMLVLSNGDKDEALEMIDEAIRRRGPLSDLIDTRGMVYWYRGETDKALDDLIRSIRSGPSAIKSFHLALAHQANGDLSAAAAQLAEAHQRKLDLKNMSSPEKKWYDKLVSDVE